MGGDNRASPSSARRTVSVSTTHVLGSVAVSLLLAGCVSAPTFSDDGLLIGALLPITGQLAAAGESVERALLMAAENANENGGVAGQSVVVVTEDTHSSPQRGLTAARSLLKHDVVAIVGPEHEDLAMALASSLIAAHGVLQVAANVSSPRFATVQDDDLFFRTCPSAAVYAEELVARMQQDAVWRAVVLHSDDEYGNAFANVVTHAVSAAGLSSASPVSIRSGEQSQTEAVSKALGARPDAIVLAVHPMDGAAVMREWAVIGTRTRWYFSPTLRSEVFVNNAPARVLNGMLGVCPAVADKERFAAAFSARWNGERPDYAAYFYYDALALIILAAQAAASEGDALTGRNVRDAIRRVANRVDPSEVPIHWYELGRGLELLRQGQQVHYSGASGDVELDARGDLATAEIEWWSVRDDKIE